MKKTVSRLILLVVSLSVVACQPEQSTGTPLDSVPSLSELAGTVVQTTPPLSMLDEDEIALGKIVYEQECASCHGLNLEGQPNWREQNEDGSFRAPPHNADGHTWHHADSLLIEAVLFGGARFDGKGIGGTSPMPAYEDKLTDEEIMSVLTYIKSSWPENIRQRQWEVTATTIVE